MLLVCFLPLVMAAEGDIQDVNNVPSIQEANRYLSAEATKQIKAMKEEVLSEVKANNDANFQQLDARMSDLMADVKMKIVLAALGVTMLGNGIGVFFLIRSFRNNSYEAYLETMLEKTNADLTAERSQEAQMLKAELSQRDLQGIQEQQGAWKQPAPQSYGTQLGQVAVSQQSMTNEWQTAPVYAGSWESPVRTRDEVNVRPEEQANFEQAAQEFVELHQDPYEEIQPQQDTPQSFPNLYPEQYPQGNGPAIPWEPQQQEYYPENQEQYQDNQNQGY